MNDLDWRAASSTTAFALDMLADVDQEGDFRKHDRNDVAGGDAVLDRGACLGKLYVRKITNALSLKCHIKHRRLISRNEPHHIWMPIASDVAARVGNISAILYSGTPGAWGFEGTTDDEGNGQLKLPFAIGKPGKQNDSVSHQTTDQ